MTVGFRGKKWPFFFFPIWKSHVFAYPRDFQIETPPQIAEILDTMAAEAASNPKMQPPSATPPAASVAVVSLLPTLTLKLFHAFLHHPELILMCSQNTP